jgi:hypothetical protein
VPVASVSAAERPDPLDRKSPVVPKSQRDPAVKLCCDMFGPYVTGCVARTEMCHYALEAYCSEAWRRGAHLSDIEPGLRKLAVSDRYFVPKPCIAPKAP